MAETLVAQPPVSTTKKCPKCGALIPVDPGYVAWCDKCSWNLRPYIGARPKNKLDKLYARLGEKFSKQLFDKMAQQPHLQPRLTLSKALAFAVAALVHCVTLLFAYLCVALVVQGWSNYLIVGVGVICGFIAWALRPRLPQLDRAEKEGIVARKDFPTLYALAERVALAVGARPPAQIIIDSRFNASYQRVGLLRQPILTLGLPLLAILDPQEQVALIGHEMGHGANGDANRGLFIGTALMSLIAWYAMLHPGRIWDLRRGDNFIDAFAQTIGWLLSCLPLWGLILLANLMWRDNQRAEYLADALAARVAGTSAELSSLDKLHYGATLNLTLQHASLSNRQLDLMGEFRQAIAAVPAREIERISRVEQMVQSRLDVSHPPTVFRVNLLRGRPTNDPQIVLDPAEYAHLQAELVTLNDKIQTDLMDQHKAGLYNNYEYAPPASDAANLEHLGLPSAPDAS